MTAALLASGVLLSQRAPYEKLPDERRRALARRLIDSGLPLVSDWVRAMRALALSYYFEASEGFMA